MDDVLQNRVANSGLLSLDLASIYPKEELAEFDLKPFLFMELVLKEKDFREKLKLEDWSKFSGKIVGVLCSTDAIIPVWAFMLVGSYLSGVAKAVHFGTASDALRKEFIDRIEKIDIERFDNQRVVIKGCGDIPILPEGYLAITNKLRPIVKSIMYGEPCSTVPVFKRKD